MKLATLEKVIDFLHTKGIREVDSIEFSNAWYSFKCGEHSLEVPSESNTVGKSLFTERTKGLFESHQIVRPA